MIEEARERAARRRGALYTLAMPQCELPPARLRSRSAFAGPGRRRFRRKPGQDPAGSADKLVRAAEQLSVNSLIDPVTALACAEAELALPRGREQQAALVEAPAAEHAPHLQALDSTKGILSVDANLVFGLAHSGRLQPTSGTQSQRQLHRAHGVNVYSFTSPLPPMARPRRWWRPSYALSLSPTARLLRGSWAPGPHRR
jgi:hypothetical protein